MKKIIVALLLMAAMTSCKKETNCGLITSDDASDYSVTIRNDQTKHEKKFYLTQGDWLNAHPGDNYCITNVDSW